MMKKCLLLSLSFGMIAAVKAQSSRWQQRVQYEINVNVNDTDNTFTGVEKIVYSNNSPDTLTKLFFHTYWNAFQPNSSMDVRSKELGKTALRKDANGNTVYDWDSRVRDRIGNLQPNEIGYQSVAYVLVNMRKQVLKEHETILEVQLDRPILPNSKAYLQLAFKAQVPLQVRRSGRDNAEGIKYSMSQWYPKLCEYDYQGWNANPYIAREFYGVWGDYDVTINMNSDYMIAATGMLENASMIGYGYGPPGLKAAKPIDGKYKWHFVAENVHDFVWAADKDYIHLSKKVTDGPLLQVFYKRKDGKADSAWNQVLWAAEQLLPFMEKRFGKYVYPQYSFIQGGDGGMEYAMATLLKGPGVGTVAHEWMHSWYQHMLGTNESLYPWMDEGFTSFAEDEIMDYYNKEVAANSPWLSDKEKADIAAEVQRNKSELPARQFGNYGGYFALARSPYAEPLSTHADHFNSNFGYSLSSYSKGAVFLGQLGYIIGDNLRDQVLLEYYREWRFKHPNANDFVRVAEKVSGLELQWYKEYWINSIKTIDYAVGDINRINDTTYITLKRIGKMPMPIDVVVTFKDGSQETHYIPLNLMFGAKPAEAGQINRIVHREWRWTHPDYLLPVSRPVGEIRSIEIDPTKRMADVNPANNLLKIPG